MSELSLREVIHPNRELEELYKSLIGIDAQKETLLQHLQLFFQPALFEDWKRKHHKDDLPAFANGFHASPLFLFSGEVGCGKSALAQSVGTPLHHKIHKKILVMETPSNIRGTGKVGELSNRITETFGMAKQKVNAGNPGILIIDEADDLATSRGQNQAHHEDRAGLNVLIKQIDLLKAEKRSLAVILITNRASVLDPAVLRRAEVQLTFDRPKLADYSGIFSQLLAGTKHSKHDLENLVEVAKARPIRYSYSDLFLRVGKTAFQEAVFGDKAYGPAVLEAVLRRTDPTPLLTEARLI